MKKNVLLIVSSLGVGGMEKFAITLFKELHDRINFDFLIFDNSRLEYLDEVIALGAEVHQYRKQKSKMAFFYEMAFVDKILKLKQFDLIYVNSCSLKGLLTAVVPAKKNHIKIITHAHSVGYSSKNYFDFVIRKMMINYISRTIDFGYACSKEAACSKYNSNFINSQKYKTINNAVNINDYSFSQKTRQSLRKSLGIENKVVIGIVGRLEKEKNHCFIFKVMYEIIQDNPDFILLVIGSGSMLNDLKKMSEEMNLQKNIIFLGTRKDANIWYSAMDMFVLPSLYEGFPYVLVEAQINGLRCCVSSNITQDVDISHTVEFISVAEQDSVLRWKKTMLEINKRIPDYNSQLVKDTFNIKNEISEIYGNIESL